MPLARGDHSFQHRHLRETSFSSMKKDVALTGNAGGHRVPACQVSPHNLSDGRRRDAVSAQPAGAERSSENCLETRSSLISNICT